MKVKLFTGCALVLAVLAVSGCDDPVERVGARKQERPAQFNTDNLSLIGNTGRVQIFEFRPPSDPNRLCIYAHAFGSHTQLKCWKTE